MFEIGLNNMDEYFRVNLSYGRFATRSYQSVVAHSMFCILFILLIIIAIITAERHFCMESPVPLFIVTPLCGDTDLEQELDIVKCLQSMAHDRVVRIKQLAEVPELTDGDFATASAVLCRPTTGGNSLADHLGKLAAPSVEPLVRVFGSVSVGSLPKLQQFTIPADLDIQSASSATNAESVADLVVWFALESQRPFCGMGRGMSTCTYYSLANNLDSGPHFQIPDIDSSRRLAEVSWCFLGLGKQTQAVLRRLTAMQLYDFRVYHYKFPQWIRDGNTAAIAGKLREEVMKALGRPVECDPLLSSGDQNGSLTYTCTDGHGLYLRFRVFETGEEAVQHSDIISIHLRSNAETNQFVNTSVLSSMKKDAVLINTARQEIWDEEAVQLAIQNCKIRVATDLLHPACEAKPYVTLSNNAVLAGLPGRSGAFHGFSSTLGDELGHRFGEDSVDDDEDYLVQSVDSLVPRSLVTRHIGGSTWQDINAIATEVLIRCVDAIDSSGSGRLGETKQIKDLKNRWPKFKDVIATRRRIP